VSLTILLLWNSIFPPPAPVGPKDLPQAGNDKGMEGDAIGEGPAAEEPGPGDVRPETEADEEDEEVEPPVVDSPPYLTLGSVTPEGPYRLLATIDSRGATIRRLELSSLDFRDLHDKAGYLGQLELIDVPGGGALVQVVGLGTPAAEAGLEPNDVIVRIAAPQIKRIEGGDVYFAEDVGKLLEKSKPRDSVEVSFRRGGREQTLTLLLASRPLDLLRPEAENVLLHHDTLPEDFEHHPSLEVALLKVGGKSMGDPVLEQANHDLATGVWVVKSRGNDRLELSMVLPKLRLEVVKRFGLPSVPEESRSEIAFAGYHLDFDIEIRNLSKQPQEVTYRLQGPNGLPIEGWWYANKVGRGWSGYGLRDVVLRVYNHAEKDFSCRSIAEDDIDPYGDGESLAYMGVDAQYFAAAILPVKESPDERHYALFTPNLGSTRLSEKAIQAKYENSSFRLTSRSLELAAAGGKGDRQSDRSQLFAGPKRPRLLASYYASAAEDHTLEGFLYYGWFGSVGIPQTMVWILSLFFGLVGNYGVAIILLTVLVRSCMFPLSRKQAKNMIKMQELKPEMDRITARHKDDAQARTKAQQALWAKHNYNPMGGCLMMFFQFPIFIGLYRALMVNVDLRQASLIPGVHWCSNLAAPDMFWDWAGFWPKWFVNGEGMFALGPYLNVLPLVTVGLFLLQQKLFMPPATDDQSIMMQKMMKYMMVFMSFMFFKVAAGLCLYFIASSLWGIAERKLIPQAAKPEEGDSDLATPTPVREPPTRKNRPNNKRGKGNKGKRKR